MHQLRQDSDYDSASATWTAAVKSENQSFEMEQTAQGHLYFRQDDYLGPSAGKTAFRVLLEIEQSGQLGLSDETETRSNQTLRETMDAMERLSLLERSPPSKNAPARSFLQRFARNDTSPRTCSRKFSRVDR